MAIELAIVLGFTGLIRSVPFLSALMIGAHPEACAEYILQPVSFTNPIFTSSLKALANFGRIVPPADATTMCLGASNQVVRPLQIRGFLHLRNSTAAD